jgi:hypothetical protein
MVRKRTIDGAALKSPSMVFQGQLVTYIKEAIKGTINLKEWIE